MKIKLGKEGFGVFVERNYKKGELILKMSGVFRFEPTRYSIQIDRFKHLEVEGKDISRQEKGYAWRYLNHSCVPNIKISGLDVVALENIKAGEEIKFNYNSTEWEMAASFVCDCGNCNGKWIQGFKYLTYKERKLLNPVLSDYLKSNTDEMVD